MSISSKYIHRQKYSSNFLDLENATKKCLLKKYSSKNPTSLKYQYIGLIMENLIFNKNTHEVTTFKDYMIWDYYDEFLKRFYLIKESNQRVPKFSTFYKNYLKFFCIPTLRDKYPNETIHECSEKKAELFYNENYKRKKKDSSELKDCGICQDSESDLSESKSKNDIQNISKKIFFNESARKKIEKNSPINTSMILNESETKLKEDDSGLLITVSELYSSNENSLRDIMVGMKKKNKLNKNNNKQKLILYANDYISSQIINKNKEKNARNKSLDILMNNNYINNNNKSKQLTINNKIKNKEEINSKNYLININSSNKIRKKNNDNKIITSINNNNYYNHSRNLSQNPQILSTINNNTYSINNNQDKINNIKKTINLNLINSKNIQNNLGKYNINPSIYINSNKEKKLKNNNNNKITNKKENIANSAKSIFIQNDNIKLTSYKYFLKNSSYSKVKLPKAKANTIRINKDSLRISSYKDFQKSDNEDIKKTNYKNKIINTKLSFDGIMHNKNMNNSNRKYNIINYNGGKHIHNINININNHINIGTKQFQEIFTFSDLLKKQNKNITNSNKKNNNIYSTLKYNNNINKYISRNKNQAFDLNSINNKTNNNKMNSVTDIHNSIIKNSLYKTQYFIDKGKSPPIYNFKQKKANKIKLNNENLFSSLKNKIYH